MKTGLLLSFFLYCYITISCKTENEKEELPKSDTTYIDVNSFINSELPIEFNYNKRKSLFEGVASTFLHALENNPLNQLFQDSTYIGLVAYPTDHPNGMKKDTTSGTKPILFKSFRPMNNNSIYLFTYLNQKNDLAKGETVELQTFDQLNKIIDKLIIFDRISYEGTSWTRESKIRKDYGIEVNDIYSSIDYEKDEKGKLEFKKVITSEYKIDSSGYILRYFDKDSGNVQIGYKDPFGNDNVFFSEKGIVKNHFKNGVWEETTPSKIDNEILSIKKGNYIQSSGIYLNGRKEGKWIYLRSIKDENVPLYIEVYKLGRLIELTTDEERMRDKYLN